MKDDDEPENARDGKTAPSLPIIPGEHPLRHDASVWMKKSEARLGALLAVAKGKFPPSALRIIDHDLADSVPRRGVLGNQRGAQRVLF